MKAYSKKKKIFLVDDNTHFQDIVTSMLSAKYNIITSKSGEAALKFLINNKPDLILLDITMVDVDGWEIYHQIKGISLLNQVPIAFVATLSEEEGMENATRLGAIDYFKKPIKRTDFLKRIKKILIYRTTLQ